MMPRRTTPAQRAALETANLQRKAKAQARTRPLAAILRDAMPALQRAAAEEAAGPAPTFKARKLYAEARGTGAQDAMSVRVYHAGAVVDVVARRCVCGASAEVPRCLGRARRFAARLER